MRCDTCGGSIIREPIDTTFTHEDRGLVELTCLSCGRREGESAFAPPRVRDCVIRSCLLPAAPDRKLCADHLGGIKRLRVKV